MSTEHDTDYAVYESSDECKCPKPNDADDEAIDAYYDNHPPGEGLSENINICMATPLGTFCRECSGDQGDWAGHIEACDDCGYDADDCDCPEVTPDA